MVTQTKEETKLVYAEDYVAPTGGDDNLDIDFGEKGLMTKGDGFDKIAPPLKEVARVNLLTDIVKSKGAWVHFVTGKGAVRCTSRHNEEGNLVGAPATCCKRLNHDKDQASQFAAVALAFLYKNASPLDGKYPTPAPPIVWELGWVKLSRSGYRRVSNLRQEDQEAHEFDMLISWKTGEKKGGYDYTVIASRARFRQNPELLAEVLEAAQEFRDGKKLAEKLGKVLTDMELLVMIGDSGATSAANANVDDITNI